MLFHVQVDAFIEATDIDSAMRLMQQEFDPEKDDSAMQPDSIIDIRPVKED